MESRIRATATFMAERITKGALSSQASGVLTDVRVLARDTAELLRQVMESSHATRQTGWFLIAGMGAVLVGSILLCLMFVQLLAWSFPDQPLWVWYAAVGAPVLGAGIVLTAVGRRSLKSLTPLQQQSANVVRDATAAAEHVGQTVEIARQSLHDTAESVREAFDLREQFNKRPWLVIGGAASLGYVGGVLLHDDGLRRPAPSANAATDDLSRARGTVARLAQQLAPEVAQLKGLALGALLGMVRDLAVKSTPQRMENEVADVITGITVKLGGSPVQGAALGGSPNANGASRTTQ